MRFMKLWAPAIVGVFVSLSSASALPVPKLPPEATDKPSIAVRVRPIGELLKDAAYIAKMVGQEEVFEGMKPGIDPMIECLDLRKAVGFYAKIGPMGVDSHGVLMLPVKNQKDFLATLALLNVVATEGQGGLFTMTPPGSPFPVLFRFANGYVYATVRNTPEAEAGIALGKLYAPEAIFKQGDASLFSVTFNVDALPNELKRKVLTGLEDGVRDVRTDKLAQEKNPLVRAFAETMLEEVATKVQSLIVDTQAVTLRVDLDRVKEDVGLSMNLTPRPNTNLASELATLGLGKSLGAGLATPTSMISLFGNAAVPASMKKALDPLIDDFVAQGWKKAKADEQPYAKELLEILAPTLKAGILDFGADFRGPTANDNAAMVVIVAVKEADKLEALVRKVYGVLSEEEKKDIKLDADKAGAVAVHVFTIKDRHDENDIFGPNAKGAVAFRKDAVVFAIGPVADAIAAVKSGLETTPKSGPVMEGVAAIRRFAPVMEKKDPGSVAAAKKAYPPGINDEYRVTVIGGQSLDVRFTSSARIIQFGMLLEQARRNR